MLTAGEEELAARAARAGRADPGRRGGRGDGAGRRRRAAAARAAGAGGGGRRRRAPTRWRRGCARATRRWSGGSRTGGCCSTRARSPRTSWRPPAARSPRRASTVPDPVLAPLTLGTAGHIDHGKTALIRALTGVDTDRLPEERERGISIELGYAPLTLPGGRRLSVVDVPGPRAVRAHDGRGRDRHRPVPDGRRRRRRRDAADARARGGAARRSACARASWRSPRPTSPTRRGRSSEAAELLPGAEAVAVLGAHRRGARRARGRARARRRPALPGRGRRRRAARAARRPRVHDPRRRHGRHRARCGRAAPGAATRVELLPAGARARVRGVAGPRRARRPRPRPASASRSTSRASAVDRGRARRRGRRRAGAAPPASATGSTRRSTGSPPSAARRRRARRGPPRHARGAARLAELGGRFAQLRLEQPLVARGGRPLVIRALAPPDTLGGGVVLDPGPRRHGPSRDLLARLARLERGEPEPAERARSGHRSRRRPAPPRALGPAALAVEDELRDAGAEPPLDAELDAAPSSPRCATPAAPSGSARRCTSTPRRSPRSARGCVALLEAEGEVSSRACATSSAPRASTRRRCSSTSTPSA